MKHYFTILFSITLTVVLILSSCSKDESTLPDNNNNDNDNPNENTTSGYFLTKHLIETQSPCFVNVMLQISDADGNGIENLTTENFIVQEDNQDVSPSESAMKIKKKDALSYKLKTVLMLDVSYSVGNDLEKIKTAAKNLVNNIGTEQEVAIYTFSENAVLIQDFTSNISTLNSAINSIELGFTTTNLYGSIVVGASKWTDSYTTTSIEQGFMILISDGSDTQGSVTLETALSSINGKKVYTVGLGAEQDESALQQIGTSGYYKLTDYSELTTKFDEIQSKINSYANSFYWLYYMSPKRGDNNHILKVSIKENINTESNSYIEGNFNSNEFYSASKSVIINDGEENIDILTNTYELTAITILEDNTPSYTWSSSNSSIQISVNSTDNSKATIVANDQIGESTTITVTDIENNLTATLNVTVKGGDFTDNRDGNAYKYVKIGNQIWMAENLAYQPSTGNYWAYDNDNSNIETYGYMYDWETANTIAPNGWHLPNDNEWLELISFLGDNAGGKLKSKELWDSPNTNATNTSHFSALPAGMRRQMSDDFTTKGRYTFFWSSDGPFDDGANGSVYQLYQGNGEILNEDGYYGNIENGYSVRCIKD